MGREVERCRSREIESIGIKLATMVNSMLTFDIDIFKNLY